MGRARVNIILAPICLLLTLLQTRRPNKNNIYLLFKNTKLIINQRPHQISEKKPFPLYSAAAAAAVAETGSDDGGDT